MRYVLVAVVLGLFAVFAVSEQDGLRSAISGIAHADPGLLLVGLTVSLLAVVNRGMLNRAAHHAVGLDTGVASMTRTAAVGFSAQKVVKSAGAVGLAIFIRHGRRRGHTPGAVAAACVLSAAASFLALGVLMLATIVALWLSGGLTTWWLVAAAGFAVYATLVAVGAVAIVRSRTWARRLWGWGHAVGRRLPIVRRRMADPVPFPEELFDAVAEARRRPAASVRLIAHAVASKCLGALMLAAAAAAVGLPVTVVSALAVYATALASSVVSIVPGGLGTVEASTASLLIASGASVGAAAVAVALFRLLDLWMPLLAGMVMGRGELRTVR
ncbi:MAG: lysylphosphatidylglycerol synthase transmembrane domain-containing protein [Ilumatobacter sp.]|uniref:lysylphosphatidylglycerol synthase transmembrane domain-containing protein n=1 Tax=Ilumatobacter sp. TaxID=1967498 RepID=UPI002621129C|nr:lysylphosphatidylglycerol synthase transmembrane domain-containing protein [Ilumatobacter sp.]MDJ0767777.1 lysylphosphatidylglycerol synthase transmembrane domain-containing protein [Ilumatobacter sp.]